MFVVGHCGEGTDIALGSQCNQYATLFISAQEKARGPALESQPSLSWLHLIKRRATRRHACVPLFHRPVLGSPCLSLEMPDLGEAESQPSGGERTLKWLIAH